MTHIMVDIETLGTAPGCPILSIGAAVFYPETGEITSEFIANITLDSCLAVGLKPDQKTLEWWREPERAEAWALLQTSQMSLGTALADFADFYKRWGGVELWCHGPAFDEVILAAAWRAYGMRTPWPYSAPRCTRTIYALAGVEPDRTKGVHHGALDDCRSQVAAVHEAWVKLGLEGADRC